MYPRNASSPPRLAIGAVVAIADGAVQTSGVSVKVRPEGGTASAGGGTVAYEEGIVLYTPTQAETNYTAFVVIAYKTGCVPVSLAVVTSNSSTAGTPDLSALATASALSTVSGKIDTVDDLLDTEVAAIKAKTDNLPAAPAATGDIPSASTIATAVLTRAITEPSGVFAWASANLENIMALLGAMARNKQTQTATTYTLRNDADDATIGTSTVSDDGTTTTRGELS